jgi:peptide/nickel transport system substrate-binding protein
MLAGMSLLAACAPAAPDGSAVRFDVAADPASLNPLFLRVDASGVEGQLARLAFEPFFDLDAKGRQIPALAREVPTVADGGVSRDGRTIVYHLRRGVDWSDGVPVTARDVLFTLRALRDPANPVASREGYDLIERADAPDDFTVRFRLSRPWAPAVATFFTYGTSAQYVLPEHVLKGEPLARAAFNAAPGVGDGPFNFVSWARGDRIVYAANLTYWRGRPKVDRLDVGIVPDPGTNLTLLQSGSIDFNLIAPAQQAVLKNNEGLAYAYAPTAIVAGIALNLTHPPLDDVRVRRALAQSIDRRGISAKVTLGRYPVADSDRPRFSWAYDPSVREPGYDPAAADAALDAAGWTRGGDGMRRRAGRALSLTYVQFPESATGRNAATLVQRELHDRGIDVTLKFISNAQLFLPAKEGGVLAAGNFDLAYVPWFMGADPDDAFLYGCRDAVKNYMRYCDSEVERLEREAVAQPDEGRRRAAYVAIDRIVARDVPIVYLFNPTYVYAYRTQLRGFAPNAFVPDPNAYEWSLR